MHSVDDQLAQTSSPHRDFVVLLMPVTQFAGDGTGLGTTQVTEPITESAQDIRIVYDRNRPNLHCIGYSSRQTRLHCRSIDVSWGLQLHNVQFTPNDLAHRLMRGNPRPAVTECCHKEQPASALGFKEGYSANSVEV
jgi:hypothetical protein